MACEKRFRGWPKPVTEYVCSQYSLFPELPLSNYAKGVKTLVRHGFMPNEEDFRRLADLYKRNPYGRRTWPVLISALTASLKTGKDPFEEMERILSEGVRKWWWLWWLS